MSSEWKATDKWSILKILFDRTISGKADASLTVVGVFTALGRSISSAVVAIYLDELVEQSLVSKQSQGPRDRYRITSAGIRYVDELSEPKEVAIDSRRWTGAYSIQIDAAQTKEIIEKIKELRGVIESAPLTNQEKSQAISLVAAALSFAEAPQPAWQMVKETVLLIASIASCLSLALQIAGMIH